MDERIRERAREWCADNIEDWDQCNPSWANELVSHLATFALSERDAATEDAFEFLKDTRNHELNCDFEEQCVCTCDVQLLLKRFKKRFISPRTECIADDVIEWNKRKALVASPPEGAAPNWMENRLEGSAKYWVGRAEKAEAEVRELRAKLNEYTENRKVSDCVDCGRSIWFREARIQDETGIYHPLCRVAKRAEAAESRLKSALETLRLAHEWSARFPLQGMRASDADLAAAGQVYDACEAVLSGAQSSGTGEETK